MHSVEFNKQTFEEVKSLNGVSSPATYVSGDYKENTVGLVRLDITPTKNDQELQTFPSAALTLCHFHLD